MSGGGGNPRRPRGEAMRRSGPPFVRSVRIGSIFDFKVCYPRKFVADLKADLPNEANKSFVINGRHVLLRILSPNCSRAERGREPTGNRGKSFRPPTGSWEDLEDEDRVPETGRRGKGRTLLPNSRRRMHGHASTGPRTPEGLARSWRPRWEARAVFFRNQRGTKTPTRTYPAE